MNTITLLFKLAVRAILATLILGTALAQAPANKASVSGSFLGNGKDGNIKHLVVTAREPFNDKGAIRLVFAEKDPGKSTNLEMDVMFNRLGSALMISVFKDGTIFGCVVSHSAHEKSGFTALGDIKTEDFKITDTQVSGHVTTGGALDAFGQIWAVDLKFSAPLPAGAFAMGAVENTTDGKSKAEKKNSKSEKSDIEMGTVEKGPRPAITQLPLPAGAQGVEYKILVQQISFTARSPVSSVAKDFASRLAAQGWKEAPGSVISKSNAILKRKLNGAELTAMVQPSGTGCTVKIFTEGFDWSDAPDVAEPTPAASSAKINPDNIEAKADRLLQDALKKFPGVK